MAYSRAGASGIYFTGEGDDGQQWARVRFQAGVRTVPAGSLQFVDFSKPDEGADDDAGGSLNVADLRSPHPFAAKFIEAAQQARVARDALAADAKLPIAQRLSAAKRAVHVAVEQDQPLAELGGRTDVAALSYALSGQYQGDRVAAFIYSMASMLITAHGGRTQYYLTDSLDAQFIHNAARNIEKAQWMLANRRDNQGRPWLLSNEISAEGYNLSYAVEFGKIVARLDLLTDVLDERYRRIGVNYAHGLLFLNFLPVQ